MDSCKDKKTGEIFNYETDGYYFSVYDNETGFVIQEHSMILRKEFNETFEQIKEK